MANEEKLMIEFAPTIFPPKTRKSKREEKWNRMVGNPGCTNESYFLSEVDEECIQVRQKIQF